MPNNKKDKWHSTRSHITESRFYTHNLPKHKLYMERKPGKVQEMLPIFRSSRKSSKYKWWQNRNMYKNIDLTEPTHTDHLFMDRKKNWTQLNFNMGSIYLTFKFTVKGLPPLSIWSSISWLTLSSSKFSIFRNWVLTYTKVVETNLLNR